MHTQILVIGGGPAGSTAAGLLARDGFEVTLFEKASFPRYHIGESLLPASMEIFDILGVREKLENSDFVKKYGVYFEWGIEQWQTNFRDRKGSIAYGFQVERAAFDTLLLEHAKEQGVKVFEGTEIQKLFFLEGRPTHATWAQVNMGDNTGEVSFDYLIDASGRAGIMSMQYLKNRQYTDEFQNVAIWGYWQNAKKMERGPEGGTFVISCPDGWFWGIPVKNNLLSAGLVIHKTAFNERRKHHHNLEQLYLDAIHENSFLAQLVESGKLISAIHTEQDYSYSATHFAAQGYFLAGDAACFLDPLLSTGVHLATFSALLTASCLASILRGEINENEAILFYNHSYQKTYLRFLVLVTSLYQQYRGKASYFWEAQQLSRYDYSATDLQTAFTSIISGLEDLDDADYRVYERILKEASQAYADGINMMQHPQTWKTMTMEERQKVNNSYRLLDNLTKDSSLFSETAVDGLYVVSKPKLGLARVEDFS